jgi:hypothetical protein
MLSSVRLQIRFIAFAALALALARPAGAAPVTIDFESLANLALVTNQFAADQVVFSNLIVLESFSTLNEVDFPPTSGVHAVSGVAPGPTVIDFLLPARLFSVQLITADTALAEAFGAGDVLLDSELVVANLGSNTEVAFVRVSPDIEYVRFASQVTGNSFSLTLDDVGFDTDQIPEPSTLVLLVAGLIPLAIHRGRRAGAAQRDRLR